MYSSRERAISQLFRSAENLGPIQLARESGLGVLSERRVVSDWSMVSGSGEGEASGDVRPKEAQSRSLMSDQTSRQRPSMSRTFSEFFLAFLGAEDPGMGLLFSKSCWPPGGD